MPKDNPFKKLAKGKGGNDAAGMFERLGNEPDNQLTKQPLNQSTRQPGKRSNPDYIQKGAYIPKALDKRVKRALLEYEGDYSDLVTELLEEWLNQVSD